MEGKILEKFEKIGGQLESINQKLADHDDRFDAIDGRLADHEDRLEVIEEQLVDIRENMATRAEVEEIKQAMLTREEYLHGQDQIMTILKRLDEERLVTHDRLSRLEEIAA